MHNPHSIFHGFLSMLFGFFNGCFLPKQEISLSIDDLGFSRGYSLFEHGRSYDGLLFHMQEHLTRLKNGADNLFLSIPHSFQDLEKICYTLLEKNEIQDMGFKIYLSAGVSVSGLKLPEEGTFIISPYALPPYQESLMEGIHLHTTKLQRAFAAYKTTFYLPAFVAKKQNPLADEILFLSSSDHLLESSTAGFLAFLGDTLVVPQGPLLKSITQEMLIRLAQSHFKIERRALHYEEIPHFTEAFLCSTSKEILPIKQIDHYKMSLEHTNTKVLKNLLNDYILSRKWPFLEAFHDADCTISL